METTFSICIPNYNYEQYLGITLQSISAQSYRKFEVVVSDNYSTDNSIAVVQSFENKIEHLRWKVNKRNVGFAGNLDESGKMATAPWMIMLSSDDVMQPEALLVYKNLIEAVGEQSNIAFSCTFEKIDGNGNHLSWIKPEQIGVWFSKDIDEPLSKKFGCNVYKVASSEMLKRCLTTFRNPFNFAATCYPQSAYEKVCGYGGGRLYNPDKWFHWKLLTETEFVYFIDKPLFQYRWHQNNQAAQQTNNQVLKYWMDEYRNTFEVDHHMLKKSGLNVEQVQANFIQKVIMASAFTQLKQNNFLLAKRIFNFGMGCYPKPMQSNKYYWPMRILLMNKFVFTLFNPLVKLTNKK
jgi:glycosyltransferase involved in cell wall biosynthesis